MTVITNHTFLVGLHCHKAFWNETRHTRKKEPSLVEFIYKNEHEALVSLYQTLQTDHPSSLFKHVTSDLLSVTVDLVIDEKDGVSIYAINPVVSPKWSQTKLLALWYYVLTKTGIHVKNTYAVYINRDYVREDELDPRRLFSEVSVLDDVLSLQPITDAELATLTHVYSRQTEPNIDIGEQCNRPHPCPMISTCWKHIPHPSIFDLIGFAQKEKFRWYRRNIISLSDIPTDFHLSQSQSIQIQSEQTGKDHLDIPALQSFLKTITFPLYFIDFEAAQYTIPHYSGLRPFQAIPFQFSIHYLLTEDDSVHHSGFIAPVGEDPRYPLAKALSTLLSSPKGTLIAFNDDLERHTFGQLAEQFPEFRHQFLSLQKRIVDLAVPFNKMHFYTSKMGGKRSIKSLFHAKVGTVPYDSLHVMNGEAASKVYSRLHTINDPAHQMAILADLMKYCHMDTLAMVRLWQEIILATE